MKLYKTLFAALSATLCAGALTSCDDDFETPPVIIPEATYEVNTPISDFKQAYWQYATGDAYEIVPLNADGDSIIIGGHIVSSDACGNIFKQIVVQDESGAVLIGVNASNLNEGRYKFGEEVRINVTGLYVGNYNGLFQIGTPYEGKIGRIDEDVMKLHAQVNGLPSEEAIANLTQTVKIDEISPLKSDKDALIKYQSTLVRFENVHFVGGGTQAWSDNPGGQYYTTRYIEDTNGNRMAVNTSNRCTFAADILPKGTGTVTAILSYFKGDWQLVVSNPATDCTDGFEFVEPIASIFKESFSTGIGEFTTENITIPEGVANVWNFSSQYTCLVATGYIGGANKASDSYILSPVIDLAGQTEAYVSFDHAIRYFTSVEVARQQATLAIREAGATEWTPLAIPVYGSNNDFTFVNSGDVDITAYVGKKVQIALRYISTASKAGTWEVKNLKVNPVKNPDAPVAPDVPDVPTGETIFSEPFSAGQGDFTIDNVLLDGLSYVWKFSEQYGMVASAFAENAAHASDSYLISPVIDLAGAAKPVLTFDHVVNKFESLESAKEQATLNIREEGATQWTKIEIPNYSNNASWTFVPSGDIDLSAYSGKKIQLGFRYTSTAAKAGSWEVKNVLVKK